MFEALLAGGLSLVGGWAGAYFGGYLKKKGENLATHEDINMLLDQVRVVTQTTKEIEAKISDQLWNRQKQWELKRDVIFEATRAMAGIEDALVGLHTITQIEKQVNNPNWVTAKYDKTSEWTKAYSVFEEATLLLSAVCSREAGQSFLRYGRLLLDVAQKIAKHEDGEIFKTSVKERGTKHLELQDIVRKELGIDSVSA